MSKAISNTAPSSSPTKHASGSGKGKERARDTPPTPTVTIDQEELALLRKQLEDARDVCGYNALFGHY